MHPARRRAGVLRLLPLLFAAASLLFSAAHASVIGIDYGQEWFKVSIVKSGVPLDIVLNAESKRKTGSLVTIRDGIRYFGSSAQSLSTRFPETTFVSVKTLLGKKYNDRAVLEHSKLFSNVIKHNEERGSPVFGVEKDVYSVEEIVGMQLAHAKEQAEIFGNEQVSGAVITVPPYFNQFERRALLDAAELAGIRVITLMNDETAVALNYAMLRDFKELQYHIFYDMGAGSTVATLVKFDNVVTKEYPTSKTNKTIPQLEVLAMGYDSSLGGHSLDVVVQKLLAERFTELNVGKFKVEIEKSPRAMMRLMREANRVKTILSANAQVVSSVEGLHEDIDFKTLVTREEVEKRCAKLFERVPEPIQQVLDKTGLSVSDINSVVLVGGSARVPKVQEYITKLVGEDKIAKNVNGDEAAVLGAGFRAASLSKQFRVREIRVKDIHEFPIEVVYNTEVNEATGASKKVNTLLFGEKTALGSKKLMNFKRETDFSFDLVYKPDQSVLVTTSVTGVTAAIEKYKGQYSKPPKVKAFIELTEAGVVSVDDAHLHLELDKPEGSLKDNIMAFFGGGKKDKDDATASSDDPDSKPPEEVTGSETLKNEMEAAGKNDTEKEKKKAKEEVKVKTEKVKLTVDLEYKTLSPLAADVKAAIKAKFDKMNADDAARREREEARNTLESFVYQSKDLMYDDVMELIATEKERETFKQLLDETSDWLYDEGEHAPTNKLKEKLKAVQGNHRPLVFRRTEHLNRPGAVEKLKEGLKELEEFVAKARKEFEEDVKKEAEIAASASAAAAAAKETEAVDDAEDEGEGGESSSSSTSTSSSAKPKATTKAPYTAPPPLYSEDDLTSLDKLRAKTAEWLSSKIADQGKLRPYDPPVLLTSDIQTRKEEIFNELSRVLLKKRIGSDERERRERLRKKAEQRKLKKKKEEEKKKKEEEKAKEKEGGKDGEKKHDEL
ncbi:Hsp70 protein-domain-containing protein [Cladochytrium replicatum]|nr:Hsp70 protein-domain-containing protein [Cladochytrium replicatum]